MQVNLQLIPLLLSIMFSPVLKLDKRIYTVLYICSQRNLHESEMSILEIIFNTINSATLITLIVLDQTNSLMASVTPQVLTHLLKTTFAFCIILHYPIFWGRMLLCILDYLETLCCSSLLRKFSIAQCVLKLSMCQPYPPKSCNHRHVLPHLAALLLVTTCQVTLLYAYIHEWIDSSSPDILKQTSKWWS